MKGEAFKRGRLELGLTQEELAAKLKCDRRTIIRWEKNDWAIPHTVAMVMAMLRDAENGKRR